MSLYRPLGQQFVPNSEAMGDAEAGGESAFHVTHERVGGMFPGEV